MEELIFLIDEFVTLRGMYVDRNAEINTPENSFSDSPECLFYKSLLLKHLKILKTLADDLFDSCSFYILTKNRNPFSENVLKMELNVDYLHIQLALDDEIDSENDENAGKELLQSAKETEDPEADYIVKDDDAEEVDDTYVNEVKSICCFNNHFEGDEHVSKSYVDTPLSSSENLLSPEDDDFVYRLYKSGEKINRLYCLMFVALGIDNANYNLINNSSFNTSTKSCQDKMYLSKYSSSDQEVQNILEIISTLKTANSVDLMEKDEVLYNFNVIINRFNRLRHTYLNRVVIGEIKMWNDLEWEKYQKADSSMTINDLTDEEDVESAVIDTVIQEYPPCEFANPVRRTARGVSKIPQTHLVGESGEGTWQPSNVCEDLEKSTEAFYEYDFSMEFKKDKCKIL